MSELKTKQTGFTIIEVVLVLAIAGLIFLMVFIALPALQRNQRDTQRRNDVGRLLSQISNFQTNNRGKIPVGQTEVDAFKAQYLQAGGDDFSDPNDDTPYMVLHRTAGTDGSNPPPKSTIFFHTAAICGNGGIATTTGASTRKVASRITLEGGGVFCQNN